MFRGFNVRGDIPAIAPSVAAFVLVALALSTAAAQGIVERTRRDEIVRMSANDPAMAAAFRKARATLDKFLRIAKSPPPNTRRFAVKVAVADGKEIEYFWISPFARQGRTFKGRLKSIPRVVRHVSQGQEIRFRKDEIVDWMYVDVAKRRIHGNFTACADLAKETPAEAAKFRQLYGLRCDG